MKNSLAWILNTYIVLVLYQMQCPAAQSSPVDVPKLEEKVFVIPDDNCGEYHVPAGQQNALIYEQKAVYNQNTQKWSWSYTDKLQLPVKCLRCSNIVERHKKEKRQEDGRPPNPANFMKIVYLGNDVFRGSLICLQRKNPVDNFAPIKFWIDQLILGSYENKLAKSLLADMNQMNRTISSQMGVATNLEVTTLVMKDKQLTQENLAKIGTYYNFLKLLDEPQTQIDTLGKNLAHPPEYDKIMDIFSSNSLSYEFNENSEEVSEICEDVLNSQEFVGRFPYNPNHWLAYFSILSKGWGCLSCPKASFSGFTQRTLHYVSYLRVPGYEGIPENWQLAERPFYLEMHCAATKNETLDLSSNSITGLTNFYSTVDSKFKVGNCFDRFPNCAVCDQQSPYGCKMCGDKFSLVNVTQDDGIVQPRCMYHFCPAGFKQVLRYNGFSSCQKCVISDCNRCGNVEGQIQNETTGEWANGKTEVCLECKGGLIPDRLKTMCLSPLENLPNLKQSTKGASASSSMTFIIEPVKEMYPQNITASDIEAILQKEDANAFFFIQQALSKINKAASNYSEVNATIWLTKGQHFFFYCHEKSELPESGKSDNDSAAQAADALRRDVLCSIDSMVAALPRTDNVNLVIRSYSCDSYEAKNTDRARFDLAWFYSVCSNLGPTAKSDERAVVFVNGPEFYFNLTRTALIKDIIFDGVNAFAQVQVGNVTAVPTPHWPAQLCKINETRDGSVDGETLLEKAKNDPQGRGYGFLPLTPMKNSSAFMYDRAWNTTYVQNCTYHGKRVNLLNRGARAELDEILKSTYPSVYGNLSASEKQARKERIQRSFEHNRYDLLSGKNHDTVVAEKEDHTSHLFAKAFRPGKGGTLFNLYAFTYEDSFQKNITSMHHNQSLREDYKAPTLILDNVEVKNFLHDYESLIRIESDNYQVGWDLLGAKTYYHFGNYKVAANITILGSRFYDSAFSRGMIHLQARQEFQGLTQSELVYRHQDNQGLTNSQLVEQTLALSNAQQQIKIYDSVFSNLNYGAVLYGLEQLTSAPNATTTSRGMILSISDFSGPIEFVNNTVRNNMAFIPTAIMSNAPKFNQKHFDPSPQHTFLSPSATVPGQKVLHFEKDGEEADVVNHTVHYLNYYHPQRDAQLLRDEGETVSPLYLANVNASHILFENNTFDSNVGLHGGAFHIDLRVKGAAAHQRPNDFTAFVYLKNNTFTRNMAYFSGNAVYIRGHSPTTPIAALVSKLLYLNVEVVDCNFSKNFGLASAEGSALHIDGGQGAKYLSTQQRHQAQILAYTSHLLNKTDAFRGGNFTYGKNNEFNKVGSPKVVRILQTNFTQNYGGFRASGVNLARLQKSEVHMHNLSFSNNTAALSLFEVEHSLPFYDKLTDGNYTLNYFQFSNATECTNEIAQFGRNACSSQYLYDGDSARAAGNATRQGQPATQGPSVLYSWPHMHGVINLAGNAKVVLTNSNFTLNDAGLHLESEQIVGAQEDQGTEQEEAKEYARASILYAGESQRYVLVSDCYFARNEAPYMADLIMRYNIDLYNFFPPYQFRAGSAPLFTLYEVRQSSGEYPFRIQRSTFEHQASVAVAAVTGARPAALLVSNVKINKHTVFFEENVVHNFTVMGTGSTLLKLEHWGTAEITRNTIFNVGKLLPDYKLPYNLSDEAASAIPLTQGQGHQTASTAVGVADIRSRLRPGQTHRINSNVFKNIYAQEHGVLAIAPEHFETVRYVLSDNQYENVYGARRAGILGASVRGKVSGQDNGASQGLGLVVLENEILREVTSGSQAGAYRLSSPPGSRLLALIVRNSTFALMKGARRTLFLTGATVHAANCTFAESAAVLPANATVDLPGPLLALFNRPRNETLADQVDTSASVWLFGEAATAAGSAIPADAFRLESSENTWASEHPRGSQFRARVQLGPIVGISNIFKGFNIDEAPTRDYNQFVNCTFQDYRHTLNLTSLFLVTLGTKASFTNAKFSRIESLVIRKTDNSALIVESSKMDHIGLHTLLRSGSAEADQYDPEIAVRVLDIDKAHPVYGGILEASDWDIPAGFLLAQGGESVIRDCVFNRSVSVIGLLRATGKESMLVDRTSFERIVGQDHAAILFIIQNTGAVVHFRNSRVRDSVASQAMFSLNYGRLAMHNATFEGNYAAASANIIHMIFSSADIHNTTVDNSRNVHELSPDAVAQVEAAYASIGSKSTFTTRNSTFRNLRAKTSSFLGCIGRSDVVVTDIRLYNLSSSYSSMYFYTAASLRLEGMIAVDVDGLLIDSMYGAFFISNVTFYPNSRAGAVIGIYASRGEIRNVLVARDEAYLDLRDSTGQQRAVDVRETPGHVWIHDSQFVNMTAEAPGQSTGAAIRVARGNKNVTIERCLFHNNTAKSGGALHIAEVGTVVLKGNTFRGNRAQKAGADQSFDPLVDQQSLRGGALFLDCVKSANQKCDVQLSGGNTFYNNTATIQGGAISVSSAGYTDLDNSTVLVNNSAILVDQQVAAYVTGVQISFDNETTRTENYTDPATNLTVEQVVVPSGQPIQVLVSLVDDTGALMAYQNSSWAILSLGSAPTDARQAARRALVVSNAIKPHLLNGQKQAVKGVFRFDKLIVNLQPGANETLWFHFSGVASNGVPKQFVDEPIGIRVFSRRCISGEEQTEQGTCRKCGYGFYLIDPPDRVRACLQCDINAVCYGENVIAPRDGHYRSSATSVIITECFNQKACKGGDKDHPMGVCAEGYRGYMCGSCDATWVNDDSKSCRECPSPAASGIQAGVRLIFLTALVFFILNLQNQLAETDNSVYAAFIGLTKLIINHCTVTAAITNIEYHWSAPVSATVAVQGKVVTFLSKFVDFNCFLNGGMELGEPGEAVYRNLIFTCLAPVTALAWFAFLYTLMGLVRGSFSALRTQLVSTALVVFWLFHADICHVVFASFACIDPEGTGTQRLYEDLDTLCWTGNHRWVVSFVSVPALIVFVFGLPLLLFKKLRDNAKLVQQIPSKKDLARGAQFSVTHFQRRFGFVIQGIRPEYYYWECVVFARKTLMIFAAEYLSCISEDVQVLVSIIICIGNLMIIIKAKPMATERGNMMNVFGQATQMIMLYNGLFYITGHDQWYMAAGTGIDWVFIPVTFVPSVVFFGMWLDAIKLQVLIMLYNYNKSIFKCLTFNLIDPNSFHREHIAVIDLQEELRSLAYVSGSGGPDESTDGGDQLTRMKRKLSMTGGPKASATLRALKQLEEDPLRARLKQLLGEQVARNQEISVIQQELERKRAFQALGISTVDEDLAKAEKAESEIKRLRKAIKDNDRALKHSARKKDRDDRKDQPVPANVPEQRFVDVAKLEKELNDKLREQFTKSVVGKGGEAKLKAQEMASSLGISEEGSTLKRGENDVQPQSVQPTRQESESKQRRPPKPPAKPIIPRESLLGNRLVGEGGVRSRLGRDLVKELIPSTNNPEKKKQNRQKPVVELPYQEEEKQETLKDRIKNKARERRSAVGGATSSQGGPISAHGSVAGSLKGSRK